MLLSEGWFGFPGSDEEIDEVIEIVNERLSWRDVLTYLGIQFETRKSGVLVARCVFHREKTPSLTLYPRPGQLRFCCYGCGYSGHMMKFLRQYFGMWELDEVVRFAGNFTRARSTDPGQLWLPFYPDS